jgi:hypothetical protein
VLGRSLAATGVPDEALEVLREAVTRADGPGGTPLLRWQARAALGEAALGSAATGAEAETSLSEAGTLINGIAGSLAAERAARYLAAPQVVAVLERAG